MAEVGVSRPSGHHQHVVLDLAGLQLAGRRLKLKHAPVEVHARHLAHHHADVVPVAEHGAKRCGDLVGRKRPRGHLVVERLEQVVVVAVDQGDVGLGVAQRLDGEEAAEAAAHHNHALPGRIGHARQASLGGFGAALPRRSEVAFAGAEAVERPPDRAVNGVIVRRDLPARVGFPA